MGHLFSKEKGRGSEGTEKIADPECCSIFINLVTLDIQANWVVLCLLLFFKIKATVSGMNQSTKQA